MEIEKLSKKTAKALIVNHYNNNRERVQELIKEKRKEQKRISRELKRWTK